MSIEEKNGTPPNEDQSDYRSRAAAMRKLAEMTSQPEVRAAYLELAGYLDALAAFHDARKSGGSS